MLMLTLLQADLDLIVHALRRLEQDESRNAQIYSEQAADLLERWDFILLESSKDEEE